MPAPAAAAPLIPYLSMAAVGFLVYRRARRSFGVQVWKPGAAVARFTLLALVMASLAFAAYGLAGVAPGIGLGTLAGTALAVLSLRLTDTQWRDGQGVYTPNAWIGGALMMLLVGRLAWRWADGAFGDGSAGAFQASPLTMGIAATVVMYSLVQVAGLWWRMRRLRQASGTAV